MGASANPRQEMQRQALLAFQSEGVEGEQRREAIIARTKESPEKRT